MTKTYNASDIFRTEMGFGIEDLIGMEHSPFEGNQGLGNTPPSASAMGAQQHKAMTQAMLEKMARAMLRAEIDREPHAWDLPEHEWSIEALEVHGFISNARAALQALREPTSHMIEVGDQVVLRHFAVHTHSDEEPTYRTSCPAPEHLWSYMIDAALQEKT